jgi:hypothetical protein
MCRQKETGWVSFGGGGEDERGRWGDGGGGVVWARLLGSKLGNKGEFDQQFSPDWRTKDFQPEWNRKLRQLCTGLTSGYLTLEQRWSWSSIAAVYWPDHRLPQLLTESCPEAVLA